MGEGGNRDPSLMGFARVPGAKNWLIRSISTGYKYAKKNPPVNPALLFKMDGSIFCWYHILLTGMADGTTDIDYDIAPFLDR